MTNFEWEFPCHKSKESSVPRDSKSAFGSPSIYAKINLQRSSRCIFELAVRLKTLRSSIVRSEKDENLRVTNCSTLKNSE